MPKNKNWSRALKLINILLDLLLHNIDINYVSFIITYIIHTRKLIHHDAWSNSCLQCDGHRWQMSKRNEKGLFFFLRAFLLSLSASQVSIVGPSNNPQPLILNPLAARIRRQAPIYRFWNNGDWTAPRMRPFIK